MSIAAFILAPAVVLGLGAFVMALLDKAHKRQRRTALLNKTQGLGR